MVKVKTEAYKELWNKLKESVSDYATNPVNFMDEAYGIKRLIYEKMCEMEEEANNGKDCQISRR